METMTENLDQVQTQFGRTAAAYATSQVHAKGASLARLLQAAAPSRIGGCWTWLPARGTRRCCLRRMWPRWWLVT